MNDSNVGIEREIAYLENRIDSLEQNNANLQSKLKAQQTELEKARELIILCNGYFMLVEQRASTKESTLKNVLEIRKTIMEFLKTKEGER